MGTSTPTNQRKNSRNLRKNTGNHWKNNRRPDKTLNIPSKMVKNTAETVSSRHYDMKTSCNNPREVNLEIFHIQ
jgi:hypothetical protein